MKKYLLLSLVCAFCSFGTGCSTTKTTINPETGSETFELPLDKLYLPKVKYD